MLQQEVELETFVLSVILLCTNVSCSLKRLALPFEKFLCNRKCFSSLLTICPCFDEITSRVRTPTCDQLNLFLQFCHQPQLPICLSSPAISGSWIVGELEDQRNVLAPSTTLMQVHRRHGPCSA